MRQILLHIGTFKTGTTSFQHWFNDHSEFIYTATGVRWHQGQFPDSREIAAICLDAHKETPAMVYGFFPPRFSEEWFTWAAEVRANIQREIESSNNPILFSCEALCLLRTDSELERLKELFPADRTHIIVALRDPKDFLSSWRKHLRHDFYKKSKDPTSFAYVKKDSWLTDYEELHNAYLKHYGEHITTINYDRAIALNGSIIPDLAGTFNVDHQTLPEWSNYFLNKSNRPPRQPMKGIARPIHYLRFYMWKAIMKLKTKPSSR